MATAVSQLTSVPSPLVCPPRPQDKIHVCPQTVTNNISSTVVRAQLQKGQSAKYLLPDIVVDYIYENGLYGAVKGYVDNPVYPRM